MANIVTMKRNGKTRYYIRITSNGKKGYVQGFSTTSKKEALAKKKEVEKDVVSNRNSNSITIVKPEIETFPGTSVKNYFENYIHENKYKWASTTIKHYTKFVKVWLEFCEKNNLMLLSEVKAIHIDSFKNLLFQKSFKTNNVNHYIKFVKSVFRRAFEYDVVTYDLAKKIKLERVKDSTQTKPFDPKMLDEVISLINSKYSWYLPCFTFGIYTGMREGEIAALRWDWINFNDNVIVIPASLTKARYERVVPIHPKLLEILQNIQRFDDGFVFRNSKNTPITACVISHTFTKIKKKLSLPKEIKFHSLRSTFITKAIKSSGNIVAVQKIVGHRSLEVTQRYVDSFLEDKITAMNSLSF